MRILTTIGSMGIFLCLLVPLARAGQSDSPSFTSTKAPAYRVSPNRRVESPEDVKSPGEAKEKRAPRRKEKTKKSGIAYEELKTLSQLVQIGDKEEDVKKQLGEPAIVSTDAENRLMWIYTEAKTVKGTPCQVIKWKLMFKRGRLSDWSEPKEETYAGECEGK